MRILDINVINFRNIKERRFDFGDSITYVYGKNGSGKTNLLEAIYYLSCGKSFRNVKDGDIKMRQADYFHIDGDVLSKNRGYRIGIGVESGTKKIFVDDKEIKKISALFGIFVPVIFSPDDMGIINGSPSIRRRFIDRMIAAIDIEYIKNLKRYNYALDQRNRLLRETREDERLFSAYETIMIENGMEIAKRRHNIVNFLNGSLSSIYRDITGVSDKISVDYNTSFLKTNENELFLKYKNSRNRDMIIKRTSFGVHTDDIRILMNGENSRYFASTGEKKSIVISIRVSESDIYYKTGGEYPVMLLDDIFSELDASRRNKLLNFFIGKNQIIMASPERYDVGTHVEYIDMEKLYA